MVRIQVTTFLVMCGVLTGTALWEHLSGFWPFILLCCLTTVAAIWAWPGFLTTNTRRDLPQNPYFWRHPRKE